MTELDPKDRYDLQCRVLIVLVSIVLITGLILFALASGYDGIALVTAIGVIGSIAGSFLGVKITDLARTVRGK